MKDKKNNCKTIVKEISKNYWAVSAIILGILLVGILVLDQGNGSNITEKEAGQKVINFAKAQGTEVSLIEVNDKGSLYEVVISIQGQDAPVYITKDGDNFISSLIPLEDNSITSETSKKTSSSQNIPKSDKPKVEAFVMSHCPYGTQIEKGLIPVVNLLGDKIDFKIKFVSYAMHPSQGEVEEQLNQYCIQEEQNDKYLSYLSCFLEAGNGEDCLTKIEIDKTKLKTCTEKTDKEFDIIANLNDKSKWSGGKFPQFNIYKADNEKYGVQGSPTLIINGQKTQSGRDSVNLLDIICSSFNEAPEECNTDFTSIGTPAPGFGFGTQGGSATAAGCGV